MTKRKAMIKKGDKNNAKEEEEKKERKNSYVS